MEQNPVSREEYEAEKRATSNKLDAIHTDVKGLQTDVKAVLEWQNQFKGGLKVILWLIGIIGTVGGAIKLFKHD